MIHGVWLADGRARYRNRYVLTKGLKAEMRAGRALYGGVMTPVAPSAELVGTDPDPEGFKLLPDINIIRHAHRFLALAEGTAPYEVTGELDTIGRYDFAGAMPMGMCAHPKIDPVSGEVILFLRPRGALSLLGGGRPGWAGHTPARSDRRDRSRLHDPRLPHHRGLSRPRHLPGRLRPFAGRAGSEPVRLGARSRGQDRRHPAARAGREGPLGHGRRLLVLALRQRLAG